MSEGESSSSTYEKGTQLSAKVGTTYVDKLNKCAVQFGDNKTNALRVAIDLLEEEVEDGETRVGTIERVQKQLVNLNESVVTLQDDQETLKRLINGLERLIIQSVSENPSDSNRTERSGFGLEVFRILQKSGQPLTFDGIVERSELTAKDVEDGIEHLLAKDRLSEIKEDGVYLYDIRGFQG